MQSVRLISIYYKYEVRNLSKLKNKQIGFIGLGKMGRPMAANLAAKGFRVRAYDIRPDAAQGLDRDGLVWSDAVSQIAKASRVIFTMLFSGEQVSQIMLDPDGILQTAAPDTVVVDMTTSDPAITRELGAMCAEKNIHLN